jgi:hypothetical protein
MGIVYRIMFIVGILYTFISFAISGISGALHLGSHVGNIHTHAYGDHAAGHMENIDSLSSHIGHDLGITHTFFSWLTVLINPIVTVSFLTVFGGLGILGTDYFRWMAVIVFFVSLSAGVIVAFILYRFIVIPLYKSENSTDVSKEDLIYTTADIISPIMENGFGEIKYTVNSIRYTAPAKHFKGKAVKQGEKVIIYNIENNIFYVIEYSDLNTIEME